MRHHWGVGLVIAAGTLWGLVAMSFLLPLLRAPTFLSRTAVGLLAAEFVTLLAWSYAREDCSDTACGAGTALTRAVAFEDIPLLSLAMLAATLVYARRALGGAAR